MKLLSKVLKVGGVVAVLAAPVACTGNKDAPVEPVVAGQAAKAGENAAKAGENAAVKAGENAVKAGEAAVGAKASNAVDAAKPAADTKSGKSDSAPKKDSGAQFFVKLHALNVRSGPGTNHKVLRTVKFNEQLTELGRTNGWVKIGPDAYVWAKYLSPSKNSKPIMADKAP